MDKHQFSSMEEELERLAGNHEVAYEFSLCADPTYKVHFSNFLYQPLPAV